MNSKPIYTSCAGLNNNIIKLRKANKFNQRQMSKLLNVSRSAYAAWEDGRNRPPLEAIMAMKDAFKIPDVVDMIQDSNWVPPDKKH